MKVLVVGAGGREHALAWKLHASPSVDAVYAAPGNPGIAQIAQCFKTSDYVKLARTLEVDLTVVGPEAPLVRGIVDEFRTGGLAIVGPAAQAAALEGSKIHSKQVMRELGIPTARFRIAAGPQDVAVDRIRFPSVFKTDGLAAGKGVIIVQTREEVDAALTALPWPIVIEEFLVGEEISFIALCDGEHAVPLEPSQDHKRVFDGDQGPNTGGMGAYSDQAILGPTERGRIMDTVIKPVVKATRYTGFLYAGLMMTTDGPKVLEFNVRLGDPETQALMMRLESDWGEALMAAARGSLTEDMLAWSPDPAACVVIASGGYPGQFEIGRTITGIDQVKEAVVFHAGTKLEGKHPVTAGGRVLGVTARGPDLKTSLDRAYDAVGRIHFDGMHFRKDIGARGLQRYNIVGSGT